MLVKMRADVDGKTKERERLDSLAMVIDQPRQSGESDEDLRARCTMAVPSQLRRARAEGTIFREHDAGRMPKDDAFLDRAWLAWHSMPRQPNGRPPSWRGIELDHRLAEGTFSKMFKGERREHALPMYERLARALGCDVLWLVHGVGSPPEPSGPVPPRDAPPERDAVEKALAVFRRALQGASVPPRAARAAVAAATAALQDDAAAPEDAARTAAVAFALANGLPAAAVERATSMPAPASWTAEHWYTRIKSIAAEGQ